MEINAVQAQLNKLQTAIDGFRGSLDLDQLQENIAINEAKMATPDFWENPTQAQALIAVTNHDKERYNQLQSLAENLHSLQDTLEVLAELPDAELEAEFNKELATEQEAVDQYRLSLLLNGKYDANNAIVEINSGAGGTEACDWTAMLLRMYTRWGEKNGFQVAVVADQPGETAGISQVTLTVTGHNAYGYLKSEKGVHRLVRISPFDAAGRRHTSFASVDVLPELDETVQVTINPDDLRVDVFRSSGAGGQHINKTSSAVRITHLPTGIVTSSQAQRSQLQNRVTAMNMLKSKLYELELEKQAQEKAQLEGKQLEIGWGSQIRSYVFHPYTLVKDHRTNYETANGKAVMDGDLNPFITAYLQWNLQHKNLK
ncbi:peptide chain release factor 2 [Fructilactobacillus florum]|uniref:peptide chain release factor 2 n=1 Tax=Fructilactobacillus florum TaxID=640331 RepID=UPI001F40447B|nr:peptide chain release factor 2 [Fructilactobacillus florum]